jgi:hypothetical protein
MTEVWTPSLPGYRTQQKQIAFQVGRPSIAIGKSFRSLETFLLGFEFDFRGEFAWHSANSAS